MNRCALAIVFALLTGVFARAADAANLLFNWKFDNGCVGWQTVQGFYQPVVSWQRLDALQSAESGSMGLSVTVPSNGASAVAQCVAVTAGSKYAAGVKVMIPGGQANTDARMTLQAYSGADCSGATVGGQSSVLGAVPASHGSFTPLALHQIEIPSNVRSMRVMLTLTGGPGQLTANFDDPYFGLEGGCVADDRTVCLDGGRFSVSAMFTAPGKSSQSAHMVQLTPDTTYMWFFERTNVEVTLKVLDACAISTSHWVFSAGLTNVSVTIMVIDTLTGAVRAYSNSQGEYFKPQFDTSAFACP
jgi:hypothetical protein